MGCAAISYPTIADAHRWRLIMTGAMLICMPYAGSISHLLSYWEFVLEKRRKGCCRCRFVVGSMTGLSFVLRICTIWRCNCFGFDGFCYLLLKYGMITCTRQAKFEYDLAWSMCSCMRQTFDNRFSADLHSVINHERARESTHTHTESLYDIRIHTF